MRYGSWDWIKRVFSDLILGKSFVVCTGDHEGEWEDYLYEADPAYYPGSIIHINGQPYELYRIEPLEKICNDDAIFYVCFRPVSKS